MSELYKAITQNGKPDKNGNRVGYDSERDYLILLDPEGGQHPIGRISEEDSLKVLTIFENQVNMHGLTKSWGINLYTYTKVDVVKIITEVFEYKTLSEEIKNHGMLFGSEPYDYMTKVYMPSYLFEKTVIDKMAGPMVEQLGMEWFLTLKEELSKPYISKLSKDILNQRLKSTIVPAAKDVFKALKLCQPSDARVVIISDEPYKGEFADGLAFSSNNDEVVPDALINIFKEVEDDIYDGFLLRFHPELSRWAEQGVLLLNSVLTNTTKHYVSHKGLGWELFTTTIIRKLTEFKSHIVYILLGNEAKVYKELIDSSQNLIIEADHPSQAYAKGNNFLGSKIFSKANEYLKSKEEFNQYPVVW